MLQDGFFPEFRRGVLEYAVACYENQLEDSRKCDKPLYRPRAWQTVTRRKKKLLGKMGWFRPADTVLRVPYTPGSELIKEVRRVVEEEGHRLDLKIKTVEGAGVSLRRSVVTKDLGA